MIHNENSFTVQHRYEKEHCISLSKLDASAQIRRDSVLLSGYINMRSKRHVWKRHWMVLREASLNVYKDDKEYVLENLMHREDMQSVINLNSLPNQESSFEFVLIGSKESWFMSSDSEQMFLNWLHVLSTLVASRPISISKTQTARNVYCKVSNSQSLSSPSTSFSSLESPTEMQYYASPQSFDKISFQLDPTNNTIQLQDWMYLRGKFNTWKKRWAVLYNDRLEIWTGDKKYKCHSILLFNIIAIRDLIKESSSSLFYTDSYDKTKVRCIIEIELAETKYKLSSGSDLMTHQRWISTLQQSSSC